MPKEASVQLLDFDSEDIDAMILAEREALEVGMAPNVARCMVQVESGKNHRAVSKKGARGLLQVMPANLKRCGLKEKSELFQKRKNVRCGVQIADEDIDANGGSLVRGLWNYNGGPRAVQTLLKCGHNRKCMGGYTESYDYANAVLDCAARDIR